MVNKVGWARGGSRVRFGLYVYADDVSFFHTHAKPELLVQAAGDCEPMVKQALGELELDLVAQKCYNFVALPGEMVGEAQ